MVGLLVCFVLVFQNRKQRKAGWSVPVENTHVHFVSCLAIHMEPGPIPLVGSMDGVNHCHRQME